MLSLEQRVGELEGQYSFFAGQLKEILLFIRASQKENRGRFDLLEARLGGIDNRFDAVDHRLDNIEINLQAFQEEVRTALNESGVRMGRMEQMLEALPRALAEEIAKNSK